MNSIRRSTFVTVVAWIFLVFSAFSSLIGILQNLLVWTVMRPWERPLDPGRSTTSPLDWITSHIELWFAAVLLVSLFTLASSLGLLLRKEWARRAFIVVLTLGIAWMVFGLVLQFAMATTVPSPVPSRYGFELMATLSRIMSGAISIALAGVFGWIIRGLVSPAVRAEFA